MIGTDGARRALAVILSVLLHGGAVAVLSGRPLIADTPTVRPKPQPTQVRLDFLPPPPPPEVVPAAPQPLPPSETEPPPQPEPKPKPVAKKAVEKKPAPSPKPKPEPKATADPQPAPVATAQPAPPVPPPPTAPPPDVEGMFRAKLKERIEANKFYPPLARRRDIAGVVQIRFDVDCQGKLNGLKGEGGHLLLKNAAIEAVEKSLPLAPPPGVKCPLEMRFGIRFELE